MASERLFCAGKCVWWLVCSTRLLRDGSAHGQLSLVEPEAERTEDEAKCLLVVAGLGAGLRMVSTLVAITQQIHTLHCNVS